MELKLLPDALRNDHLKLGGDSYHFHEFVLRSFYRPWLRMSIYISIGYNNANRISIHIGMPISLSIVRSDYQGGRRLSSRRKPNSSPISASSRPSPGRSKIPDSMTRRVVLLPSLYSYPLVFERLWPAIPRFRPARYRRPEISESSRWIWRRRRQTSSGSSSIDGQGWPRREDFCHRAP